MSVIAMFAIAAAGLTLAVGASLGVKWSQVQILSARPANMQVERLLAVLDHPLVGQLVDAPGAGVRPSSSRTRQRIASSSRNSESMVATSRMRGG